MQLYSTEYNPFTDATERWYWDSDTNTFTIREEFDVTDVIEANKRQRNQSVDQRFGKEQL